MTDSDVHDGLIGRTIAQFTIEGRLGEGGMGIVYLGHDRRLSRYVAIKVIAPMAAHDPDLARRLLREARAASTLNHPNIVTVYEIGNADGIDFIVMERVEGTPLDRLIGPGGLPVRQAIDIGLQVAAAVAAAHGVHIVHRDLKPSNVMVMPSGRVKVLDFGLARTISPTLPDEYADTIPTLQRLTGSGSIVGSVGYMAPEQIEGKPAHASSDVFSLGIMLFEMLTGRRPFAGGTMWAIMAATLEGSVPPVDSLRPEVSKELARIVARCLARRPEHRYPSAADVAAQLQDLAATRPDAAAESRRRPSRAVVAVPLALAVVALSVVAWLLVHESRVRWARETATGEIERLTANGDLVGAYVVARRALAIAPQDIRLQQAWTHLAILVARLDSEPTGTEVAIRSYRGGEPRWLSLGKTPVTDVHIPFGLLRWRLTHPGYDTLEVGQGIDVMRFKLSPSGTTPPGMVLVPAGSLQLEYTGEAVQLPEYWLDRCEVTNRQYRAFVEAGGYRKRQYWREPFVQAGRTIPWELAMNRFRDATGRPGPATWDLGQYPEGQDDYPVRGVSWYEAAAYAVFAGRQLPTVYHWYRASGALGIFSDIVTTSNFSSKGVMPVGSMRGLGPYGTYDMAGNVKEWCWNAAEDRRFILGGGWNELAYAFHNEDARSPFERLDTFGFRCMLQREPLAARLTNRLQMFQRDPARLVAVGDEMFRAFRRLYDYDAAPLDARIETVNDASPQWREEHVTVRAAYGNERLPLRVYVPKSGSPPYQAVIHFPGTNAVRAASSRDLFLRMVDFHVQAGRVLVYPIYQGTYERRIPRALGMNEDRDVMIQRGKDIRRTIDYLATRGDIDSSRIAFYGISLGAELGPIFLAIEPRFRTGVFFAGGFETGVRSPESDPVNFAPHVKVPVLMVNGREDFALPYATAQVPMFEMLGTPPGEKRHVVLEGGHFPSRKDAAVRAILDWLDQHLGSVERL